jgi:hypothetical protein
MSSKKFPTNIGLTLMSLASGVCMFTADLNGWERQAIDYDRCKNQGDSEGTCKKRDAEINEQNFANLLRADALLLFQGFSPEDKQRAMDYADGNKMSPNDAVAKVNSENH